MWSKQHTTQRRQKHCTEKGDKFSSVESATKRLLFCAALNSVSQYITCKPLMCIHGKSEAGSAAGRTSHSTEQRLMTTHSAQIQSDTVRKGGAGVEGGLKTKAAKIATPINWVCRRVSVGWR